MVKKKLPQNEFIKIVEHTPLISIDLIVENSEGRILVGKRNNAPAKDSWFVPGGRIIKDETLLEAFSRIVRDELSLELNISQAEFLGVYEHIYPGENFANVEGFGTHYIVLGFKIRMDVKNLSLPNDQHNEYKWYTANELLNSTDVHQNTKNYFLTEDNNFVRLK